MFFVLFWSAAAYYGGLLLSERLYSLAIERIIFYVAFFIIIPLTVCAAAYIIKKMKIEILLCVPLCFIVGVYVMGIKSDKSFCPLSKYEGKEITVCGVVCSDVKKYSESSSFALKVKYVVSDGEKTEIKGKIKVSSSDIAKTGEEIIAFGTLKPVKERLNTTSYDRRRASLKDGIFYSMFSKEIRLSGEIPHLSPYEKFSYAYISAVNDYADTAFDKTTAAFLKGMLLKNKSEIPDEIVFGMSYTGLYRYIYCPYLHVSLLIFLLGGLIRERKKKIALISGLLLVYLYMNMTVPSAWKLCLFIALSYLLTYMRGLRSEKEALCLAVILTGIFSPFTLLEGGFILSAVSTAALILFSRHIRTYLKRFPVLSLVSYYVITMLATSPAAAELGYCLTPYSFAAGFVIMPLFTLVYILFGISAAVSAIFGRTLTAFIPFIIKLIVHISKAMEMLPFANVALLPRGILYVVSYYAALYGLWLILWKRNKQCFAALCVCAAFIASYSALKIINRDVAEVTFVNVDQGDCSVIKLPHDKVIMVDGGGSPVYSDYDIGAAEVVPYLRKNGIMEVETIILSHYDKDHADGIVTVMDNLPVKEIFMPDYLPNNSYRDIIEAKAAEKGVAVHYISSSCRASLENTDIEFIYTDAQKNAGDENGKSLAAKITYEGTSVLYTGDITRESEAGISDVKCDIMKIPHHGSKTSTSQHLLDEARPVFCVFSLGKDNMFKFPNQLVVDRCINSGCKIYRTDRCGDIHFYIDKSGIKKIYCFKGAKINE